MNLKIDCTKSSHIVLERFKEDNILAYRLLKSVKLSSEHKQLIKAALPELWCNSMRDQLKTTFSYSSQDRPIK